MLEKYYIKPQTIDHIRANWLAEPIERYVTWLDDRGYGARNVFRRVPLLLHFSTYAQAICPLSVATLRTFCRKYGQTIAMKAILPIILISVFVGCASVPSPQVEATSHVRPIIAALQAYHRESGDYPQQLDGLRPHYLRADVLFRNITDTKHIWYCFYDRVDQNHYSLQFYTSPCSEAIYKNGKFIAAYGPAFN